MTSFGSFPFPFSNPGGEGGSVIVVRHGERMDEVHGEREKWDKHCMENYRHCEKTLYCRANDPPLTENGKLQAKEVAHALKQELANAPEQPQVIFSSKLIRSLMTAYEVAKELSLPICVSSGFSLTAAAVEKAKMRLGQSYSFLSMEEMREMCPGVEMIDGDLEIFPVLDEETGSVSDNKFCALPGRYWDQSLRFLSNWKLSIVVAHRESIRNLSELNGQYVKAPYCCYGIFNYLKKDRFSPILLQHKERNGTILFDKDAKSDNSDEEEAVEEF